MGLSLDQMLAQAHREQTDIARYAARREGFLDALDWDAMPDSFAYETSMHDEAIDHDRLSAGFRIAYLEEQVFLANALRQSLPDAEEDPDLSLVSRSTLRSHPLARELADAYRRHAKLSRFADRREDMLDTIDWTAMTEDDPIARACIDDKIGCELGFSILHIDHLEGDQSAASGMSLDSTSIQNLI